MLQPQTIPTLIDWQQWEGRVIGGRFPLIRHLGGTEYRATYLTEFDGTRAALKLVAADSLEAPAQSSAWELARELAHPHLVRVYETGRWHADEEQDMLFAVMELAEETLAETLPTRPLTDDEARGMLAPVLDALEYLHGRSVIHGELRPANIMAVGNRVKLSCDGLRRMATTERRMARSAAYDAPERATGAVSGATDIWSLGMTLVEALSNRLPTVDRNKLEEPKLPENVAEPFADIAKHCLLLEPERRWKIAEIRKGLAEPAVVTPVAAKVAPLRTRVAEEGPTAAKDVVVASSEGRSPMTRNSYASVEQTPDETGGRTLKKPAFLGGVAVLAALGLFAGAKSLQRSGTAARPTTPAMVTQGPIASDAPIRTHDGTASPAHLLDAGAPTQEVMPEISRHARNTISGTIKVRVRLAVDASGKVSQAKLVARGPSRYFSREALAAAQKWTFSPPTVEGKAVASQWNVQFEFKRSGTRAVTQRISPAV